MLTHALFLACSLIHPLLPGPQKKPEFVPDELIVGLFRGDESQLARLNAQLGARVVEGIPKLRALRIVVPPRTDLFQTLELYAAHPAVAYAELNYLRHVHSDARDPAYPGQWAVKRIGCEDAWETSQGTPEVVIAIIDTGVDKDHPDLGGAVLEGLSRIGGVATTDAQGHGTEMAVIAAARTGNLLGSAGVAPKCSILPVQFADASGSGSDWDLMNGMMWARDQGAHVLNVSAGGPFYSVFLHNGVQNVASDDLLIVSSGGNLGVAAGEYPAAFEQVLAVTGVEQDDKRWPFANHGDDWADVAAPSLGVTATTTGGLVTGNFGTSQATAIVSGAAALLYSHLGTETSSATIRARLEDTADPVESDGWVAHGRINIHNALENANLPHRETYVPRDPVEIVGELRQGDFRSLQIREANELVVRTVPAGDDSEIWIEASIDADYVGNLTRLDVGWAIGFNVVSGVAELTRVEMYLWDFEVDAWDFRGSFYVWRDYDVSGALGTTVDPLRFLGPGNEVRVRFGRTWDPASSIYELAVDQLRVTTFAEKP